LDPIAQRDAAINANIAKHQAAKTFQQRARRVVEDEACLGLALAEEN
jgi:hypothetical protein